jgi:hypothetical protein
MQQHHAATIHATTNGHNDGVRGLSQKVAVLILCTFKCSTPAVPMRSSKPP